MYTNDLSGNIININDKTPKCGVGGTTALNREFEYDPLYRLLSANGRENSPTTTPIWDDRFRSTDSTETTAYTQNFSYDKLGNIQKLQHIGNNNFTRDFNYLSNINQLQSIDIGATNYAFVYDNCGNQTQETSSRNYEWGFDNQLRAFYIQAGTSEPSQYAHYLYGAGGERVKKVVRTQGDSYTSTVYIDGVFEYKTNGTEEQNLLHIMDDQSRIALVRLGDNFGDTTPAIKFNLEDYLGSSSLLLETNGALINKEEYYSFGETSFGSYGKKKFKFSGKERDEESGLYYFGARYYNVWACRFISIDPAKKQRNWLTPYNYVQNNPINLTDPTGALDDGGGGGDPPPVDSDLAGSPRNENSTTENIIFHLVKKGDTLGQIAVDNNISVENLREINNLDPAKDRELQIGAKLMIQNIQNKSNNTSETILKSEESIYFVQDSISKDLTVNKTHFTFQPKLTFKFEFGVGATFNTPTKVAGGTVS